MDDTVVEIAFKGEAREGLAAEFDCVGITADRGVTRMCVVAHDGAAVHGVLGQLRSLGLELLGVREVARDPHSDKTNNNTTTTNKQRNH